MEENLIEEYEINPYTMFIRPIEYEGKLYSQIYEIEDEFICPLKPLDIIKKSCAYFYGDFEGRKNGTKELLGIKHKVPIAIDVTNSIYACPTTSPSLPECIWVFPEHILKFGRVSPKETLVIFNNKQSFTFLISYRSFQTQILRTALLRTKLTQRIDRMSFYVRNRSRLEASEKRPEYK